MKYYLPERNKLLEFKSFNKQLKIVIIIFLAIAAGSGLGYLCYTLFY